MPVWGEDAWKTFKAGGSKGQLKDWVVKLVGYLQSVQKLIQQASSRLLFPSHPRISFVISARKTPTAERKPHGSQASPALSLGGWTDQFVPMKIHQLSAAEAIASLNSPQGLSSREAQRRLHEYGPNRVEEVVRESPVLRFLKEFTHFFASDPVASGGAGLFGGME